MPPIHRGRAESKIFKKQSWQPKDPWSEFGTGRVWRSGRLRSLGESSRAPVYHPPQAALPSEPDRTSPAPLHRPNAPLTQPFQPPNSIYTIYRIKIEDPFIWIASRDLDPFLSLSCSLPARARCSTTGSTRARTSQRGRASFFVDPAPSS